MVISSWPIFWQYLQLYNFRLVDTSTRYIMIPSAKLGYGSRGLIANFCQWYVCFSREDWHYCAACEAVAPPRAWHCSTCRQVREILIKLRNIENVKSFIFSVFSSGSITACLLGIVLATLTIGRRFDNIIVSLTDTFHVPDILYCSWPGPGPGLSTARI